ncbi:hypothetical protein L2E82_35614 [Cichorium intybus]|uniref:Uncharacterized protein n=1 Tax=Cichorium intybus TaxID=13427 RepID=A0ACB9BP95_CICIN|nr:hypothetical protein L2E82_35614 [Cichorium intybus]
MSCFTIAITDTYHQRTIANFSSMIHAPLKQDYYAQIKVDTGFNKCWQGHHGNKSNIDSPLQWLRADPEMEYLAEIHFNQPVQMWINQLEKDKDVVAQAQPITALELFPRLLSIVNALSNLLCDSLAYWRVRIEAAFALATTACEVMF